MKRESQDQKNEAKRQALKDQLEQKEKRIAFEKAKLAAEQDALRAQQAAIKRDQITIEQQQEKIKGLAREDKRKIDQILSRNRVNVDLDKKLFKILEPIEFQSIRVLPSMKHAPPAEFANPDAANEVLSDLAAILEVVKEPRLMIEGHTAGGAKAVSDIGFEIACEH